jgi:ABC-type branched-subunit amino acid transport system ATPase component/predicted MFS family arabinose efflux permease
MTVTESAPTLDPAGEPAVQPATEPPSKGRLPSWLSELKPSAVTGGASVTPLLLLGALNVVDGFDANAFGVLLPEIRDHFGVSLSLITTLGTITGVLGILLALPVGYLTDRVNRIWLTAIGAVIWGTMALFTGLAWSFMALVVFRFGASLGKILHPSQQSLLADYYPPHVRAGVFSFHSLANRVGNFAGPLIAGALAAAFVWQVPFLIVGLPSVVLAVVIVTKLKEPVRGEQERRLQGASEEVAKTGEAPPTWTESWRIAKSVRTIRRFWAALPFLTGSGLVIGLIMPLYYEEVFGLGPTARGTIAAFDEPFAAAGLIVGGLVSNRFLRYRPGRVITYLGLMAVLTGLSFALVAVAPVLWLAVGFSYVRDFLSAIVAPATAALLAMVIPPRARGFALSAGVVFALPGYLIFLAFGLVGDAWGLRAGLLVMTPVFLIGAIIITSAGSSVDADIRAAQAAALASYISRESKKSGNAKLLVVRDLDVHYDQVQVLFNVDFEIAQGETVALLGTNGAGKSTLLRAISGVTTASNGAIFFDGEDITFLPPSAHAGRGIIQVPGGKGVFPTLSVAENLKLAAWLHRKDDAYVRRATESVLDRFPQLRHRYNEPAGNLSGGEQQMLTLGQAFLSKPRLLMIDELSLGLAPAVVERLLGIVRDIAANGTTIILVEQSVNVALTVAERAVFMEKGEIKFSGPAAELLARPDVLHSVYLKGTGGGSVKARARQITAGEATAPALEVIGMSKSFGGIAAVNSVDLRLDEGQILGLIGPNGAGKTTLLDLVSGFISHDDGKVLLFGEDVTDTTPDERARLGLARSFQDARLFPSLTVTENIAVALERHLTSKSTIAAALHLPNVAKAERSIEKRIDRLIRLMNLDGFRDKFVRELSTGSRRIVDLACVMACDPKVLLLDEPSAGIAQREAEELGPLLHRIMWETGCSLIVIDHDMPLLTSVSDELVALELGAVVTRGTPAEVLEHPQVVASYLGTSKEVINRSGEIS